MAITIRMITKLVEHLDMKLVAGENGLDREVTWTHMVDSDIISVFLQGQELVFTTGIGLNEDLSLFELVKDVYHKGASGIVINIGPYVKSIDQDIIDFAKGVTCGYVQLGGCIVSKEVAEYFEENVLQCGLTYSGHTLACAAGVAALNYYKDHNIEEHVAKMHDIVAPFMDEMVKKHKCIGEARCIGLFGALDVLRLSNQVQHFDKNSQ